MSAWVWCATCRSLHRAVDVGGVQLVPCPRVADGPWALSGDLAPRPVAVSDCQRCGEPAHPIRGYCGRFCEEADAYDRRPQEGMLVCRRPGYHVQITNLGPPDPVDAFAEAYAALERDMAETLAGYAGGEP